MDKNNNFQNQQMYYNQPQAQNPNMAAPPQPYMPYPMQYTPLPKKQYSPLEKKDSRFMLVFLFCAVILSDFAVFKGFHLGFTIAYALIFCASTVYLYNSKNRPGAFSIACGAISLAGSVTLSLFDNMFVNALTVIMIAGLFTVYCIGLSKTFNRSQGNFKMLFDLFEGSVLNPIENLTDVFGSVKASTKKGSKNLSVIAGIALALPVLIVIIPLLVSSDAAFEGLVKSIIKNIGIYLIELAFAVLITPFVFSFMFGKRHAINKKGNMAVKSVKRIFPSAGAVSFLSVISFVYAVYLFSQLAYFFSAFKGILPEGYKYSASVYARRGFFEMFAVVAINIALISFVSALTKRKNAKLSGGVKGVSLFISLFSCLMLAIAMQKMRLNIATYGYSRNRLLVCAFMLMMIVVIAFFIIHIFAPKVPYMQAIIICCCVIFTALSFADVNTMTARYNTSAYTEGRLKSVNVEYLSDLGDSTVISLIQLTKSADKKTANRAKLAVVKCAAESESIKMDKNQSFSKASSDFRSYVKVKADSADAVIDYINSLEGNDRAEFINEYNMFKKYKLDYNEDDDAYENWEYDKGYKFNKKTGEFDFMNTIQIDE